ncbi:MAG: hypothetical protein GX417_03505 [Clostridiales bacterium]|nr:hypothetical protein [Clostridiales bacterium]
MADEQQSAPAAEPPVQNVVQFQPAEDALVMPGAAEFALRDPNALSIVSWQGAKNCGESFDITLKGVSETEPIQFSANNCTVFPQNGTGADTYTITVTGAGAYSATAMSSGTSDLCRDTRTGVAGRADQAPLSISGWGGGSDYYDRFRIQISGGSTNGTISFEADGCSVTPATGTVDTVFEVTVTRVGAYELTAMMDGNSNYNSAYSARLSGCSSKSNQSPIHIEGWVSDAKSGESFTARIYGGSTNEALTLATIGCTVSQLSSDEYQITIDAVGPYAVTATRSGNYGYNSVSASVSGVAEKTRSHTLSVSGWAESKNCNDSFPISIRGGASGAAISFAASGCIVTPATGTTDTDYTVTVTSAGGYSLSAVMSETDNFEAEETRTYHGQSGKGTQNAIKIQNWIESAPAGSAFEITVDGGSGTGATTLTTDNGCAARLKSGETSVYIITVYPLAGSDYSISVGKAGDATYEAASPVTFSGRTSGAVQTSLAVNGWNESVYSGDSFEISLSGGSGSGALEFELSGCKINPQSGSIGDTYTVTVTALEGEPYSLIVTRQSDGNYTAASIQQNGTARLFEKSAVNTMLEPVKVGTYSWVYICGGIVLLFGVVLLIMQISNTPRRHRRRR